MAIENTLRVVERVKKIAYEIQQKPHQNPAALRELTELEASFKKLENYLKKLDQLKPDYNTNEINDYVKAINLHLDILKGELDKRDYARLLYGVRVLRTILRFHPTKYSFFTFIIAWLYELLYFI